ncbi:hypothetical protein ACIHCQ_07915 [Streptomyces sp. NPDC052236]|uniref:hypothetical protein n=1 Tax=Streptomyces sp. NPDC052236 TaxID=3365686 RepID=UPI0037D7277D
MSLPRFRVGALATTTVVLLAGSFTGGTYVVGQSRDARPGTITSSFASAFPVAGPVAGQMQQASREATVSEELQVNLDAVLAKALAPVAAATDASVSVAVLDLESGDSAVHGHDEYDTASIVKVDILAALLLQAQDAGRHLTAQEKSSATAMIGSSDNDSATALWNTIGGSKGLDAANKRLGLTATTGGEGGRWGLTQTTAADQIVLLQAVFGTDSQLSEASRTYIQRLMGQITTGQDWGVSAASAAGTAGAAGAAGGGWALKNGWMPRTATGLWDINTIGRVEADGRTCLVAVLSDGNASMASGVTLVEQAARVAVTAFGTAAVRAS